MQKACKFNWLTGFDAFWFAVRRASWKIHFLLYGGQVGFDNHIIAHGRNKKYVEYIIYTITVIVTPYKMMVV